MCEALEGACGEAASKLGIPESVSGATLLAISGSAPEFFTAVISAWFFGQFEIGLMVILWSAIFNITVIPGASAFATSEPLRVARVVVSRDCVAYLVLCLLLVGLLEDGRLTRTDALILLGGYALYVYVLSLMLNSQEEPEPEPSLMPPWKVVVTLVVGVAAIGGLCHAMVWLGTQVAAGLGLGMVLISALVFAPGTSIPDLFLSIVSARRGAGSACLSNVYGSNSFDLTVCLAVPVLIVGDIQVEIAGPVLWSIVILLGTIALSILMLRIDYQLSRRAGGALLALYGLFAAGLVLSSLS
ncbi:MAG TPA: hypothetical protein DEA08_31310 [Planctomycetes bacterium]|nr:hypothetical protein [Planctomycetota bacterium]